MSRIIPKYVSFAILITCIGMLLIGCKSHNEHMESRVDTTEIAAGDTQQASISATDILEAKEIVQSVQALKLADESNPEKPEINKASKTSWVLTKTTDDGEIPGSAVARVARDGKLVAGKRMAYHIVSNDWVLVASDELFLKKYASVFNYICETYPALNASEMEEVFIRWFSR